MIKPLRIATKGLLEAQGRTISIGTKGWLGFDKIVSKIEVYENRNRKFADDSDSILLKKNNLFIEDEEIITIFKIFLECQERVLRN